MKEKKETSNTQHKGDHLPSSCELMLRMLASPPETYEPAPLFSLKLSGTIHNPSNNSDNLIRAYIACQKNLEVNPLLSTSRYSIFSTPELDKKPATEGNVLQQQGKFQLITRQGN